MISLVIAGGVIVGSGIAQNSLQRKGKFEEAEALHTFTTMALFVAGIGCGWYFLIVKNPLLVLL